LHKIKHIGRIYDKVEHWFDEECTSKKKAAKMALVENKVRG
jgi:hypothetical protein